MPAVFSGTASAAGGPEGPCPTGTPVVPGSSSGCPLSRGAPGLRPPVCVTCGTGSILHTTTSPPWLVPYHRVVLRSTEYYQVLPSTTEYYRVIQSINEYDRVLSSTTEYYGLLQSTRVLPSTIKYYRVLPRTTKYYRVLQSDTEY